MCFIERNIDASLLCDGQRLLSVDRSPLSYLAGTFFNVSTKKSQNNGTVSILSASSGE